MVESRASVLAPPPAGSYDLRVPIDEGLFDPGDLIEIGEDAAAAALVLVGAREAGLGLEFDF